MIKLRYAYNWIIVADDRREKSELGAEAVWEKGEETVCQMQRKKTLSSYWLAHPQRRRRGRKNVRRGNMGKELRLFPMSCILTEARLKPSPVNKPLLSINGALLSFAQDIKQGILYRGSKEAKGWENLSVSKVLACTGSVLPFCRF